MSDIWSAEYKATILDELKTANDANEYLNDQLAAATARAESAESELREYKRLYGNSIKEATNQAAKADTAEADAAKWREDSERLAGRLRGAEQTIRNLGHGALTGDCAQIALNEAANIRAALAAHDPATGGGPIAGVQIEQHSKLGSGCSWSGEEHKSASLHGSSENSRSQYYRELAEDARRYGHLTLSAYFMGIADGTSENLEENENVEG